MNDTPDPAFEHLFSLFIQKVIDSDPNDNVLAIAEKLVFGTKYSRTTLVEEYWHRYAVSIISFRNNIQRQKAAGKPIIFPPLLTEHKAQIDNDKEKLLEAAVIELSSDIRKYKELDLLQEASFLCEKYELSTKELAKGFSERFGCDPFHYRKREWENFPNGGGNSHYFSMISRQQSISHHAQIWRPVNSNRAPYDSDRIPYKSDKDQAWDKFIALVNDARKKVEITDV